jgi:Uma2 family endonuclease
MSTRALISRPLISVEEYLASSYEPDRDYADGRVEKRNWCDTAHATLQLRIGSYLLTHYERRGAVAATELRIRVSPTRIRIHDVCVFLSDPEEEVPTKPPFICIEVLSPEDRMSRVKKRIQDFLEMGVPHVWLLDPETKQAYVATLAEGLREVKTGVLATANPVFEVPLSEIFR